MRITSLLSLLALALPATVSAADLNPAKQQASATTKKGPAADLPISLETAQQHGCDKACHARLSAVIANDHKVYIGDDFDWDFYATAKNFSMGKPGDLLKLKPVDPKTLTTKSGIAGYRFQYVTEDLNGTYVPATGFIALPFSLPPSGKFPLVAYAHGTIGAWFGCAPSNGPVLYDYESWQLMTTAGYAVVGTDYAGLGNNAIDHKYLAYSVNALDVFHSLKAARQAFGAILSKQWVAAGHSQGGAVVWRLAEDLPSIAARYRSDEAENYLGAVSLAPATRPWDLLLAGVGVMKSGVDFHKYGIPGYFNLMSITTKRVYPDFSASILGSGMRERMPLVAKGQLCLEPATALTADLTAEQITSMVGSGPGASAADIAILEDWQKRFDPGNRANATTFGPVLVVQGVSDTAVNASVVEATWKDACALGSEVHLTLYPKQDHDGVIVTAMPDWLEWIAARFAAAKAGTLNMMARNKCTKVIKTPVDFQFARALPVVA
jgi:pimeloyl-ACP methyl ester carboxylesterase